MSEEAGRWFTVHLISGKEFTVKAKKLTINSSAGGRQGGLEYEPSGDAIDCVVFLNPSAVAAITVRNGMANPSEISVDASRPWERDRPAG